MNTERKAGQLERGRGENPPLDRMVFQSFRLSQGDFDLQTKLFQWLAAGGQLQGYNLESASMPDAVAAIRPKGRHASINAFNARTVLKKVWQQLRKVQIEEVPSKEDLLPSLLEGYIFREAEFHDSGRPVEDSKSFVEDGSPRPEAPPPPPDSLEDPHASWLRRYVLQGRSTGVAGFDQLHQEMRPLVLEELRRAESIEGLDYADPDVTETSYQVRGIMDYWEEHHPGESFISPQVREEMRQREAAKGLEEGAIDVFDAADAAVRFDAADETPLAARGEERQNRPTPQKKNMGK